MQCSGDNAGDVGDSSCAPHDISQNQIGVQLQTGDTALIQALDALHNEIAAP